MKSKRITGGKGHNTAARRDSIAEVFNQVWKGRKIEAGPEEKPRSFSNASPRRRGKFFWQPNRDRERKD